MVDRGLAHAMAWFILAGLKVDGQNTQPERPVAKTAKDIESFQLSENSNGPRRPMIKL